MPSRKLLFFFIVFFFVSDMRYLKTFLQQRLMSKFSVEPSHYFHLSLVNGKSVLGFISLVDAKMVMVTEACENPAVTYTLLTSFLNQGFINQYGLHYENIRDKI